MKILNILTPEKVLEHEPQENQLEISPVSGVKYLKIEPEQRSPFNESKGFGEDKSDTDELPDNNRKEWKTIVPQQIKLGQIKKLQQTAQVFLKAGLPRKKSSSNFSLA